MEVMTPLMEEDGGEEEEDVDVDEDSEHLPQGITWVSHQGFLCGGLCANNNFIYNNFFLNI